MKKRKEYMLRMPHEIWHRMKRDVERRLDAKPINTWIVDLIQEHYEKNPEIHALIYKKVVNGVD